MTCLTLTPHSVTEAIESKAEMVVAHHPLPFKAISKLTTQTHTGRLLWDLARAGVSVYSPHTAWDSAQHGINAQLAQLLELQDCRPIVPLSGTAFTPATIPQTSSKVAPHAHADTAALGTGRMGRLPEALSFRGISELLCERLSDCRPRGVDDGQLIRNVAVACGSGGSLLNAALSSGQCDLFLTGEATFHTCLEAQTAGISLLMIGHFASERFAMVQMASGMQLTFPQLHIWASTRERDPVSNLDPPGSRPTI